MSEELLVASQVYGRKLEKPPATWPALTITLVVAISLIMAYSLFLMRHESPRLDFSSLINTRLLFSIVPCGVVSLTLWTILYYSHVEARAPSRGPRYFNIIAASAFATSLASPVMVHGVRAVERQVALHQMREEWRQVPGLQAELASIAARDRAADSAALTALRPLLIDTDRHLAISPATVAKPADVTAMSRRIQVTLAAMAEAETEDAARWAVTRAEIDAAMRRANPPAGVREHVYTRLKIDVGIANARHGAEAGVRRQAYGETLAALNVFANAKGLWMSNGTDLLFARRSDISAIQIHVRDGQYAWRRLHDFPPEPLPSQTWSRPQPGV